jgi:hypothetical protein
MSEYYDFLNKKYERECMESELKLNLIFENHPKYHYPKPTNSKTKASTIK